MYLCKLSVRELVEFIYQGGDLVSSAPSVERANLGSRIHRMLQAAQKKDYESEVYLKIEHQISDIQFIIDGRADGVRKKDEKVTIEEIKTTAIPFSDFTEPIFVHLAQAYCYGYMYCMQHNLETIGIQMTYYQINTEEIKHFEEEKTKESLELFFIDTLTRFVKWAELKRDLKNIASSTLKDLQFPFPSYRNGQRDFAIAVYKTILDKEKLFASAPTGIGKTISTLFPSLKAIGEGKAEKIFYLCAKNITASVAIDTLHLLYKQPVHFKSVVITAKDKICFQEERNCDPKVCPFAKGYYNRSSNALYELLNETDFIHRESIEKKAKEHTICPFELSLDASLYADVIICDYNYVFDPRVYLKRFFMEKGEYVFLVDEAHNLVDRARSMYTCELQKSAFLLIARYIPKQRTVLHRAIKRINKEFLSYKKQLENNKKGFLSQSEPITPIIMQLTTFIEETDKYLQSEHEDTYDEQIRELYFNCIHYKRIHEFYDEDFVTVLEKQDKEIIIRQCCLNPAHPLKESCAMGRSTIFFSATLSPMEYYQNLLGANTEARRLFLPSPFSEKQRKIIICNQISTKYHNREASSLAIAEMIYATITAKDSNYIVFLPSYAYMKLISDVFSNEYPDILVSIQESNMKEEEKYDFLHQFNITDKLHVHFCVLGGMFSEGIDLKGDKLIGTIIIGVGLPQINPMQDLIKAHFDKDNQMGFAYSYQYPGMNKVLQAAGRVIRSQQDKGIILFIDERYTTSFYQRLIPLHMRPYQIINHTNALHQTLLSFWKDTE